MAPKAHSGSRAMGKALMANSCTHTVCKPNQREELEVAERLGVRLEKAIPPLYRPAKIDHALHWKLYSLAIRVVNLDEFQRRLVTARQRRPSGRRVPPDEQCISPTDVASALQELGRELQQDLAAQETSTPPTAPFTPVSETTQRVLAERPYLTRSSKSAASVKISKWANQLKPTRRPSTLSEQYFTAAIDHSSIDPTESYSTGERKKVEVEVERERESESEDEDDGPIIPVMKRRKTGTADLTGDALLETTIQSNDTKKEPRKRRFISGEHRCRSTKGLVGESKTSLRRNSEPIDSLLNLRRSSRRKSRTSVCTEVPKTHYVPQQEEHAFYFPMPENQHYKLNKPTRINDVATITDFDAITYPVEIPSGERGVYHEYSSPNELRELVQEIRGHSLSGIKTLLEAATEDIVEAVSSINPNLGRCLQAADKKDLERLRTQFAESITAAQEVYLDGLKSMKMGTQDQGTVADFEYIDLTIGYVDPESDEGA